MQLVEQHVIARSDPRFAVIDDAAFKAKNLYQVRRPSKVAQVQAQNEGPLPLDL